MKLCSERADTFAVNPGASMPMPLVESFGVLVHPVEECFVPELAVQRF